AGRAAVDGDAGRQRGAQSPLSYAAGPVSAGSEMQNVLPVGPLRSSTSVPPCASVIHFAIGSPRPVPLARRAASSCTNRSKILVVQNAIQHTPPGGSVAIR